MPELGCDPKFGDEADPDDPRLTGDARKVVQSGRYIAVEDGAGGLFLRAANERPGSNFPALRFMTQPSVTVALKKEK